MKGTKFIFYAEVHVELSVNPSCQYSTNHTYNIFFTGPASMYKKFRIVEVPYTVC